MMRMKHNTQEQQGEQDYKRRKTGANASIKEGARSIPANSNNEFSVKVGTSYKNDDLKALVELKKEGEKKGDK